MPLLQVKLALAYKAFICYSWIGVMSAGELSEMTGHSMRVLLKDYAGSIASNRTLPELQKD